MVEQGDPTLSQIFIDRDFKHFNLILNYFRESNVVNLEGGGIKASEFKYPENPEECEEVE